MAINTNDLEDFSHFTYYVMSPTIDTPAIPFRVLCDEEGHGFGAEQVEVGTGRLIPNLLLLSKVRKDEFINDSTKDEFDKLREALVDPPSDRAVSRC